MRQVGKEKEKKEKREHLAYHTRSANADWTDEWLAGLSHNKIPVTTEERTPRVRVDPGF